MLKKKLSKKQEEFFFDVYKSSLMALAMPEGPNRRLKRSGLLVKEAAIFAAKSVELLMNEDGIKTMDQIKEELELVESNLRFPEVEQG